MHTWDIAKLLLNQCSSADEVDEVLELLTDSSSLETLRSMLLAFSSQPRISGSPNEEPRSPKLTPRQPADAKEIPAPKEIQSIEGLPESSKAAAAKQLESVFRSADMTNQQAEHWINENFHIAVTSRKQSLENYLTRVLSAVNLGTANRMLAAAQRQLLDISHANPDIEQFWAHLDRRRPRP